jgi:hypothetical protein
MHADHQLTNWENDMYVILLMASQVYL